MNNTNEFSQTVRNRQTQFHCLLLTYYEHYRATSQPSPSDRTILEDNERKYKAGILPGVLPLASFKLTMAIR